MKARQIKETPKSQRAARTSAEEPANPRPCSCPVHLWAGKAAQAQRCPRRIEKAIMPPQPAADSPVAASLLMKAHPSHCTSSGHSLARRAHQLPPAWVSPPRKSAVRQPFWREFFFCRVRPRSAGPKLALFGGIVDRSSTLKLGFEGRHVPLRSCQGLVEFQSRSAAYGLRRDAGLVMKTAFLAPHAPRPCLPVWPCLGHACPRVLPVTTLHDDGLLGRLWVDFGSRG